jgi:hypothetical protein
MAEHCSGADGPQRTLFALFVTSSPVARRSPLAFGVKNKGATYGRDAANIDVYVGLLSDYQGY